MLSKNPQSSVLDDTRLGCSSTAHNMFSRGHTPTARATTCRVFLQRAIQIHTLFAFLNTNDHNSSNSKMVASGSSGSGATNVSLKGGSWAAFFKPIFHCVSCYAKCPCEPSHATTLLIGSYDFFTALLRIPVWCWILAALLLTRFTAISLLSIGCMTISYQISTFTVLAANGDCYHDPFSHSQVGDPFILPHHPPGMTHYQTPLNYTWLMKGHVSGWIIPLSCLQVSHGEQVYSTQTKSGKRARLSSLFLPLTEATMNWQCHASCQGGLKVSADQKGVTKHVSRWWRRR